MPAERRPDGPRSFIFWFKKIRRGNDQPDDLNVHSLRHTNAGLLIAQGWMCVLWLDGWGHAQPSATLDIYSYVFDKNKRATQANLEAQR